jgi:hypothetical protein
MNTENRRSPKRRDTTKPVAGACRGCRGQALLTHREPRSRTRLKGVAGQASLRICAKAQPAQG